MSRDTVRITHKFIVDAVERCIGQSPDALSAVCAAHTAHLLVDVRDALERCALALEGLARLDNPPPVDKYTSTP